jgi:hypothetical protein
MNSVRVSRGDRQSHQEPTIHIGQRVHFADGGSAGEYNAGMLGLARPRQHREPV